MLVGPRYRLRMSQALFFGWLSAAFTLGHLTAVEIERGAWAGWKWVAFAGCVVFPPLFARWVWENAPHRRAKRARMAERSGGD